MNIEHLVELTCKTFADIIKVNSPQEIGRRFNIQNDIPREDEEELRRENQWRFNIQHDYTREEEEDEDEEVNDTSFSFFMRQLDA